MQHPRLDTHLIILPILTHTTLVGEEVNFVALLKSSRAVYRGTTVR